jgi:hypothetical protein
MCGVLLHTQKAQPPDGCGGTPYGSREMWALTIAAHVSHPLLARLPLSTSAPCSPRAVVFGSASPPEESDLSAGLDCVGSECVVPERANVPSDLPSDAIILEESDEVKCPRT